MTSNSPEPAPDAGLPRDPSTAGDPAVPPRRPDDPGYGQPGEPAFGEPGGSYPSTGTPPPPGAGGWPQPPQDQPGQAPYGHPQGQPGAPYGQAPYGPPSFGQPGAPGGGPYGASYGSPPQGPPGYGPQYGQPGYQYGARPQVMNEADQRLWATLTHLSGLIFPLFGPLVIWLVVRERGSFVEDQAKEALNFHITLVILGVVFTVATIVTLGIGGLLFLYYIAAVVFTVLAAVAANRGERYRYPLTIRLVH